MWPLQSTTYPHLSDFAGLNISFFNDFSKVSILEHCAMFHNTYINYKYGPCTHFAELIESLRPSWSKIQINAKMGGSLA